ncbi:unnamed protein product, partial [Symbiodinium pilosum]
MPGLLEDDQTESSEKNDAAAEVEIWSLLLEDLPTEGTTGATGFLESLTPETIGGQSSSSAQFSFGSPSLQGSCNPEIPPADPAFYKQWPGETFEQYTQRLLGIPFDQTCAEARAEGHWEQEASFDFDVECEEIQGTAVTDVLVSDCVAFGGVDDRPMLEMNGTLGSRTMERPLEYIEQWQAHERTKWFGENRTVPTRNPDAEEERNSRLDKALHHP